jgi:ferredoxin
MEIKTAKLIYFSPTRTTRKILEGIAEGIAADHIEHLDLTPRAAEAGSPRTIDADLVIMGVPVYTGRVAQTAVNRLEKLKSDNNTPVVLIAVYGNRAYEDALLELKNIAEAAGFAPVAAGAFIGEHSFADDTTPIACGRPDAKDLEAASAFGQLIRNKIKKMKGPGASLPLQVPGKYPYRERTALPKGSPVTREGICTLCGTCADGCPTGAITLGDTVITDATGCIYCCACVKNCPANARVMAMPVINGIAAKLSKSCSERKTPEFYI